MIHILVLKERTFNTSFISFNFMLEKRKAFSNKDARARQTGKKGKTNSSYFEESSSHINIAPNRVPFGTLHNMPNTNGAPINLPLQTTSPQNTSRNKENITPLQTPRSYSSNSVSTNVSVDPAIQKKETTTGFITNEVEERI